MGLMSKKPKNFEKIRSPKVEIRQNRLPTYGREVCDGHFQEISEYRYYIDTHFRLHFPSLLLKNKVI